MKIIFTEIPEKLKDELIEVITSGNSCRIERIVSDGHTTPGDFWYDQKEKEFVILLSGTAKLLFENSRTINMSAGDYTIIPSGKKHKVVFTDLSQKTIWLAVFYQ